VYVPLGVVESREDRMCTITKKGIKSNSSRDLIPNYNITLSMIKRIKE